jgi:hypothetical protein
MPQLVVVQEEVVALGGGVGAAGTAGVDAGGDDVDDIDDPPPHALKAAINKVHAAVGSQRRGVRDSMVDRCEYCMEASPWHAFLLPVSAQLRSGGIENRMRQPTRAHLATNARLQRLYTAESLHAAVKRRRRSRSILNSFNTKT